MTTSSAAMKAGGAPPNARVVLGSLILVAAVANLNLSVANVALPSIGASFDSSQTVLDLIAVGYSLGLAASVLWFGALGDRYGRKMMIVLGMLITIPASLVAGFAPSDTVLFVARVAGGLAAGMAYPTTLALITALWSGPARTRSIAMWSALGGGVAMLGPLLSGFLLEYFVWGSVFLITLPLAVLALYMANKHVPAHVNEATEPVDNLGGVLSAVMIGALIVALNFITVPSLQTLAVGLFVVAARRRRAVRRPPEARREPALRPEDRRAPHVLGGGRAPASSSSARSWASPSSTSSTSRTCWATTRSRPARRSCPRSSSWSWSRHARPSSSTSAGHGPRCCWARRSSGSPSSGMLLLWGEGTNYLFVAIPLALMGLGVGLAGTPSSNSLTGSVPVRRVGMASGTADLQRDLGGALMTSIFGALLTAGYAAAMGTAIAASGQDVTATTQSELQLSYASAADLAAQYPQYADQITAAAKQSFLDGDQLAYLAGLGAVLIGMGLTFFLFPKKDEELRLRAQFLAEDRRRRRRRTRPPSPPPPAPQPG